MDTSIIDETAERLDRKAEREEKAFGLGSTLGGLRLISNYFDIYHDIILEKLKVTKGVRFTGRKQEFRDLDPEHLTLAILMAGVSACGVVKHSGDDPALHFSNSMRFLGKSIALECYGNALRSWNKDEAEKLEKQLKRASTLAYRTRLMKAKASAKGFDYKEWTDPDHLNAGAWVVEVLTEGPMFTLDDEGMLTLTTEALANVDQIMQRLIMEGAFVRPQTVEPEPWTSPTTHIEGFRHSLVRTGQKAVRKFIEREFKTGRMGPTLEAVNHAQSVRWRTNDAIVELVRHCYEQDLGVPGIPRLNPLPVPELTKPWDQMTEDEQRVFMKGRTEVKTANKGFIGERIILARDLAMAESLRGKTFWTHMNLDYRGRVYGMPHFNFQRSDVVRAMFQFEEGEVVNEEGLYWLKVHVANTGAFDKIDKAPFDDRVQWVDDNMVIIDKVARDPVSYVHHWIGADSPFMFVAACQALHDAYNGIPVHIPVSFDGSCSGLQHLCAMTKADEGYLVNLTPSDRPQDVYQTVADRVKERITADLSNSAPLSEKVPTPVCDLAKLFADYGIGRSLVKRNVMTYSYSSKKSGMKDQVMEDTMKPLAFKVMTGDLTKHPFVRHTASNMPDDFLQQLTAAQYLAGHTYDSIEEVVQRPALAMKFLQHVARLYAHEGKPVTWHTPLGFPVMLRYPNMDYKRVTLFLMDKGIRRPLAPRSYDEAPGINKRKAANGIAPSYVHSLDACHLMMVLLAAKEAGINSVALVHDSFGCLPNQAPKFRKLIKETFRDLYTQHDVLQEFLDEASVTLDEATVKKLPAVPEKGSLDLNAVLDAEYCFA